MDLSSIKGKINTILPYLTYLSGLFTKILELFGSFFGINIIDNAPSSPEADNEEITE